MLNINNKNIRARYLVWNPIFRVQFTRAYTNNSILENKTHTFTLPLSNL